MRYIFSAATLVLASLLWGCAGSKGLQYITSTMNAAEASHPEKYTLVYSIPRTTLEISVEATEVIIRRGPYYDYAEKYLGITDVPLEDETRWRIDNVEIGSYQESDPDNYYVLETNDRHVTNFFTLGEEGFILPVNQRQLPELESYMHSKGTEHKEPLYTDMSIYPKVVEQSRTVMRREMQDTAFVNVPVMIRESVTKSREDQAAEAADLIFELRSSRFRLLSGDIDIFPDGKGLETIIKEFARLEKEYLSLFTGKVFETKHEFNFEYTPDKDAMENGSEYEILFRFSDSGGILPSNDISGRPFALELENEMKTLQLDHISQEEVPGERNQNRLFYRIPDVAAVRLTDGKNTIVSKRVLIGQYGRVVSLPADFLWE